MVSYETVSLRKRIFLSGTEFVKDAAVVRPVTLKGKIILKVRKKIVMSVIILRIFPKFPMMCHSVGVNTKFTSSHQ